MYFCILHLLILAKSYRTYPLFYWIINISKINCILNSLTAEETDKFYKKDEESESSREEYEIKTKTSGKQYEEMMRRINSRGDESKEEMSY